MKAAIAGVVLGAFVAGMIACGGDIPAPTGPSKEMLDKLRKENEITQLWTQIREFRSKAHLHLEPSAQALIAAKKGSAGDQRHRVCPDNHDVPPACNDTCNLADDICDNTEQICKIAAELGKDDDFAQTKCDDAKASCREGKQKCCECPDAKEPSP